MYRKPKYSFFEMTDIKPGGWLKNVLITQAEGLAGNLDKVWPDVKDSKWIGGSREGWERVPYWLDGFIPLAYLLDNDDMKKRADRYIDAIISSQRSDGWICPCSDDDRGNYDVWAAFLICKVLSLYGGKKGFEAARKALKNLNDHIDKYPLTAWGKYRWFECLIPIYRIYEETREEWLLDLASKLKAQGAGYEVILHDDRFKVPNKKWNFEGHIVNLAMMLKSAALESQTSGGDEFRFAEEAYRFLMEYHSSMPTHFNGDEVLAGKSPIRGTELCSVAEAMYSYEILFSITGDTVWLDRLEDAAFNAFPAYFTKDMWAHQYDQMANQIGCVPFKDSSIFTTNSPDAHIFGLEPNYGCCTANMGQGWPKFALSAFMKYDGGILSSLPIPASLDTEVNGVKVNITLETGYPFRKLVKYTVKVQKSVAFELGIRIPESVEYALIDGRLAVPGGIYTINRLWEGETSFEVMFDFDFEFEPAAFDMFVLRHGPLLYSLPIEYEMVKREYELNGVARKEPYCDYDLYPKSDWNYAFAGDCFDAVEKEIDFYPFSDKNPPVEVTAKMVKINWPNHEKFDYLCAEKPTDLKPLGEVVEKTLIPYGCTLLRMTVMPNICR
jgi:hypothetical protein